MLRRKQQTVFQRILNLNEPGDDHNTSALKWKVLLFDDRGLYILSTLFKVSKLHEQGITVYSPISRKREPIPDISAVYLIQPTKENLGYLLNDIKNALYDSLYINFISRISDSDLEMFATAVAQVSDGRCVKYIFDQYVDFSSPDPNLFVLFNEQSYLSSLYSFLSDDNAIIDAANQIASALVSVFVTAGEVPRLYFRPESVGKLIADEFSKQIRQLIDAVELWQNRKPDSNSGKAILILLDRSMDYVSSVHHPCTYQALIHDIFQIDKNSVKVGDSQFDLDCDLDKFWKENRLKDFDSTKQKCSEEFKSFSEQYRNIEYDLKNTIENFTSLSHRRISLTAHTHICEGILKYLNTSKTPELFQLEENLMSESSFDFENFIELLRSISSPDDRHRTVVVAFLCDRITPDQFPILNEIVGTDVSYLNKISNWKVLTRKGIGVWNKLKQGLVGDDPAIEKLPTIESVKKILNNQPNDFQTMSPFQDSTSAIGNVYVFVAGPGNYVEYGALLELAEKGSRNLTYGCTKMERPQQFLSEFQQMLK